MVSHNALSTAEQGTTLSELVSFVSVTTGGSVGVIRLRHWLISVSFITGFIIFLTRRFATIQFVVLDIHSFRRVMLCKVSLA